MEPVKLVLRPQTDAFMKKNVFVCIRSVAAVACKSNIDIYSVDQDLIDQLYVFTCSIHFSCTKKPRHHDHCQAQGLCQRTDEVTTSRSGPH